MFFPPLKHRGDSIVEVLVALTILSSVLIATFSILNQALQVNVNVRNRVIALNIAREGLEAVRNIRDTNWLKYSGDKRKKWLCLDTPSNKNACEGGNASLINAGYYRVDYSPTDNRYYLTPEGTTTALDLENNPTAFQAFRLYKTPQGRYTHDGSAPNEPTPFYRQIYLEPKTPIAPSGCATKESCKEAQLLVQVRVQWLEEGRLRKLALEGNLFDFFNRREY